MYVQCTFCSQLHVHGHCTYVYVIICLLESEECSKTRCTLYMYTCMYICTVHVQAICIFPAYESNKLKTALFRDCWLPQWLFPCAQVLTCGWARTFPGIERFHECYASNVLVHTIYTCAIMAHVNHTWYGSFEIQIGVYIIHVGVTCRAEWSVEYYACGPCVNCYWIFIWSIFELN